MEHDGSKHYRPPSAMVNYWCTNPPDEAAYAQWATGATTDEVQGAMQEIQKKVY